MPTPLASGANLANPVAVPLRSSVLSAVARAPRTAIVVTGALLPVLFEWPFVGDVPAEMVSDLTGTVCIMDYKRALDGTELLYTNAQQDVVGISRRQPNGRWFLCWSAYDDPAFDGEIALLPGETRAIFRRERAGDFIHGNHFRPRVMDWSKSDQEFCGTDAARIDANPVAGEHGIPLPMFNP